MHKNKYGIIPTHCLSEIIHLDAKLSKILPKPCTVADLITHPEFGRDFLFPAVFPKRLEGADLGVQWGSTCGIYGFSLGMSFGHTSMNIPLPRKNHASVSADGQLPDESLRHMLKESGATAFGSIYDPRHFAKTAQQLKCDDCEVLYLPTEMNKYIQAIDTKLNMDYTILIACDTKKSSCFPGPSNGVHTHWGLIFGYFSISKEPYYFVAQYGLFYAWSAKDLFISNKRLPFYNPHFGKYRKVDGDYELIQESLQDEEKGKKYYYVKEFTYEKFAFTGFAMPVGNQQYIRFGSKVLFIAFSPSSMAYPQNLQNIFPCIKLNMKERQGIIEEALRKRDVHTLKNLAQLFPEAFSDWVRQQVYPLPIAYRDESEELIDYLLIHGVDVEIIRVFQFLTSQSAKQRWVTIHKFLNKLKEFPLKSLLNFRYSETLEIFVDYAAKNQEMQEIVNLLSTVTRSHSSRDVNSKHIKELILKVVSNYILANSVNRYSQIEPLFSDPVKKVAMETIKSAEIKAVYKKRALVNVFLSDYKVAMAAQRVFKYGNSYTVHHFLSNAYFFKSLQDMFCPGSGIVLTEKLIKNYLLAENSLSLFLVIMKIYHELTVFQLNRGAGFFSNYGSAMRELINHIEISLIKGKDLMILFEDLRRLTTKKLPFPFLEKVFQLQQQFPGFICIKNK